jgi:maltooligosyltrehalose trehalohydrolase
LNHELKRSGRYAELLQFYRELLRLRRELPAVRESRRDHAHVILIDEQHLVLAHRWCDQGEIAILMNFGEVMAETRLPETRTHGDWQPVPLLSGSLNERGEVQCPRRSAILFASHRTQ